MFRAVRFEQRYGFKIDDQTQELMAKALEMKLVDRLTGTRLFNELEKIFQEVNPLPCLQRLHELQVLTNIAPHFVHFDHTAFKEALTVKKIYEFLNVDPPLTAWKFFFLALTNNFEKDQLKALLERLLITGSTADQIVASHCGYKTILTRIATERWFDPGSPLSPADIVFCLKDLPVEGILMIMANLSSEKARGFFIEYFRKLKHIKLDITGNDLTKTLGLKPGPHYKLILDEVLKDRINGLIQTKAEQLERAKLVTTSESGYKIL